MTEMVPGYQLKLVYPYDPRVGIITRQSEHPSILVLVAAQTTHNLPIEPADMTKAERQKYLINALVAMGHTSLFEHAVITLDISQISRGCSHQLVRHRMGSFTQSSTHYTDHALARWYVDSSMTTPAMEEYAQGVASLYRDMRMTRGAEARQLLPTALETKLMWTVNARSLLNFLQQRLCHRNMKEMQLLAEQVREVAALWFPELFDSTHAAPGCYAKGLCDQGTLTCMNPWKP